MKKLLFLIMIFAAFMVTAQTKVPTVAVDGSITKPAYVSVFGTKADTITDAESKSFVFRITGDETQDFNIKLYSDFVSGSASGTVKAYSSIDGVNYAAIDTFITFTSLTADAMDAETITLEKYLYPYLKLTYTQTGTAVVVPKIYVYSKK